MYLAQNKQQQFTVVDFRPGGDMGQEHGRPASEIIVKGYRKTLIWPMRYVAPDDRSCKKLEDVLVGLGAADTPWQEISDPLKHLAMTEKAACAEQERQTTLFESEKAELLAQKARCEKAGRPTTDQDKKLEDLKAPDVRAAEERDEYAEFVYFHTFIQRFLYSAPGKDDVSAGMDRMRVFRRDDLDFATLTLTDANDSKRLISRDFKVERLRLYTFSQDFVLLVAEFADQDRDCSGAAQETMNFEQMLRFHQALRYSYAPYYADTDTPGISLRGLEFRGSGAPKSDAKGAGEDDQRDAVKESTENEKRSVASDSMIKATDAVAAVKSMSRCAPILSSFMGLLPQLADGFSWRHIVDERIPSMTYVAVADPQAVRKSDMQRFAWHEDPSSTTFSPYGKSIVDDLEKDGILDIHWQPEADKFTQMFFTASGMSVLTRDDFFGASILPTHFRRHYFQMGLIVQMQYASLLLLSDKLSHALSDMPEAYHKRRKAHDQAHAILEEVLQFTHRYWFPQISNHMQPRLMFDKWQRSLGVQRLYDTVLAEAKEASDFLSREEERVIARNSDRINKIAVLGFVIGVVTGLLGSNTFNQNELAASGNFGTLEEWGKIALLTSIVGFVVGGVMLAFNGYRGQLNRDRATTAILGVLTAASALFALFTVF